MHAPLTKLRRRTTQEQQAPAQTMADQPPQRAPIVFGLPEQAKGPSALDEAREEHRRR